MTKLDQGVGNRTHIVFRSGMVVLNNEFAYRCFEKGMRKEASDITCLEFAFLIL